MTNQKAKAHSSHSHKSAGRKRAGFNSKLEDGLTLSQIELRARLGDAADKPGGEVIRNLSALCQMLKEFKKPHDIYALFAGQPQALDHLQCILNAIMQRDAKFFSDASEYLNNLNEKPFAPAYAQIASYVHFMQTRDSEWRPTMKEIKEFSPYTGDKVIRKILRSAGIQIANPKGGRPKTKK